MNGTDAGIDAACVACDDGLFCNGVETCSEGACSAGDPPCGSRMCDEGSQTCACDIPDEDDDGIDAAECGGSDCDDSDAQRYPGNSEICDTDDHDEDCDPMTFGVRDQDGDGEADAQCCNVESDGTRNCGADCDDSRSGVLPGGAEVCNDRDDDCDTNVDEEVTMDFYPDADGDGHGDETAAPVPACEAPAGHVDIGDDCDDGNFYAFSPLSAEACDGEDNDCDGMVDDGVLPTFCIDGDGDGFGDPAMMMQVCVQPSGYVEDCTDCDDTRAQTHLGAAELCDNLDNDCLMGGGAIVTEDADNDGHAAATASCGGGTFPADDCLDNDVRVHPGQTGYFETARACPGGVRDCGALGCCRSPTCISPVMCTPPSFDYNCNGIDELIPFVGGSCATLPPPAIGCTGTGYISATTNICGQPATYRICSRDVVGCTSTTEMRPRSCR